MKSSLILVIILIIITGCSSPEGPITKSTDFSETGYSDYMVMTTFPLTDANVIFQLQEKYARTNQSRALAKTISSELEFDFSKSQIVKISDDSLKTILTPGYVDSVAEAIYLSYLKDDSVADLSVIIEYSDIDSTYYYYTDKGDPLGSITVSVDYEQEILSVVSITEEVPPAEFEGWWDTFSDCVVWATGTSQGIIGTGFLIGGALGCEDCAFAGGLIYAGIGLGCAGAAYTLN